MVVASPTVTNHGADLVLFGQEDPGAEGQQKKIAPPRHALEKPQQQLKQEDEQYKVVEKLLRLIPLDPQRKIHCIPQFVSILRVGKTYPRLEF